METLDGGDDRAFQALLGRPSRAGRRSLRRDRGARRRVWRLFGLNRREPTLSVQDQSAVFLPFAGDDFLSRNHLLADVAAIIGSLDIVFGEIDGEWRWGTPCA